MGKFLSLSGRRVSGAEHHVCLDEMRKLAHKIPHSLGRFWQKMDVRHAKRDLEVLQDYEIPIVPTRLHGETSLLLEDQTHQDAELVLEQPLLQPSHPVFYRELMHSEKIRNFVLEVLRKGEAIYREKDLGLDLMGGKAYLLPFSALNPFKRKMNAEVSNLLVADQTIQTPEAWIQNDRRRLGSVVAPLHDRRKGDSVVEKGDIRLCDVRLFDFDREGLCGHGVALALRRIREVQYAALWSLMESFGVKPEIDFDTRLQMIVRRLVQHAIPKLRAYAEEMG